MKKIIKIALTAALLTNMAAISAMGRISAYFGKGVEKFTKQQIKTLNQSTKEPASFFSSQKKKYAESFLVDVLQKRVKEGIIPTLKDIRELDYHSWMANHGVLNLAGDGGRTLLYDVLHYLPSSPESKKVTKALYDRGAELNPGDKVAMGLEKELKTYLNVSQEASAWTTVKVYRTFLTKNTEEKIQKKVSSFKMSELQAKDRQRKVKDAKELYAKVEKDLLAKRRVEQKEKYFKFSEL